MTVIEQAIKHCIDRPVGQTIKTHRLGISGTNMKAYNDPEEKEVKEGESDAAANTADASAEGETAETSAGEGAE